MMTVGGIHIKLLHALLIIKNSLVVVVGEPLLYRGTISYRDNLMLPRRRCYSTTRIRNLFPFSQRTLLHLDRNSRKKVSSAFQPMFPYSTNRKRRQIISVLQKHSITTTTSLSMSLLPIPRHIISRLIPTSNLPTSAQYATYWGRTSRERYNYIFESVGVSILGVFTCYFLSFAIGQFVSTLLGTVAAFWIVLAPEVKAYQRNWELTGGRELVDLWKYEDEDEGLNEDQRGLYGAYYFGRISHVSVVENPGCSTEEEYPLGEFEDYDMETDEMERITGLPYKLRLRVTDESLSNGVGRGQNINNNGKRRELQVHARMSEEYLDLEVGMPVCAVLLSTSISFEKLAGLTDFCVPDAGPCWIGDYPYLDRPVLENILVKDKDLWEALRREGRGSWHVNNLYIEDLDDEYEYI